MTTIAQWQGTGGQTEREIEEGQKQRGSERWRKNENALNGQIGVMSGTLLQTGLDGRTTFKPYVPHGTERIKVKVKVSKE